MKGMTYKRCRCPARYNAAGKRLACAKKHGSWSYVIDVPLSEEGRKTLGRQQITRGGFAAEDDAAAEMRRAIHLLEIPDPDDDAGHVQIADLIRDHYKRYGQLPEHDDVKRRFVVGLPLVRGQTAADWLDEWLAGKRGIARTTLRSYEGHIRLHLRPRLGHILLEKLRGPHIQAAYDGIVADSAGNPRPVGPATIRRIHATLRKALNDAVRQRRIPDSPALHVELPRARRPKPVAWTKQRVTQWMASGAHPTVAVWTPAQTGAFLDYAASDRLYACYHLLVFRGPRRGEGVGLKWTNLDLDEGVFEVETQIVQLGWETVVTEPKSDSDGTVALDSLTVAVLRTHQKQQQRERRDWGEAWVDSGYVFTTEQGEALHPDYVSRHFVRLIRRANELRLGSRGRAVADVQEALGVTPSGVYCKETKQAVMAYQQTRELAPTGVVDPHTWYRLFPDAPLRSYPHPGYLPPIRLHDLRHGAATLAHAAGTDLKVISEMLRHSTIQITADTYTTVLFEVAREAAEATARIVPRRRTVDGAVSTPLAPGRRNDAGRSSRRKNAQVRKGGAGGARTHDRRIMSPLL